MEEYLDEKIVAQRDALLRQENSSIYEGLSIGDAFYEFEPVELFEGTFNMMLPTSFVDMPLCAAKAKYPSDDRPQVIKCSMDSEINFAFHLLSEILPEESVIMETEALRQMLLRIQPANLFYECALERIFKNLTLMVYLMLKVVQWFWLNKANYAVTQAPLVVQLRIAFSVCVSPMWKAQIPIIATK